MDVILDTLLVVLQAVTLPNWASLAIAAVVTAGAFYVGVLKGKWLPAPVTSLISKMQKHFISYDALAPRVKVAVDRFRLTPAFAEWLTVTLTRIMVSVPALADAPPQQIADVMASAFTSLPVDKQAKLLPTEMGLDFKSTSFMVQKIIALVMLLPQIAEIIRGIRRTVSNGGSI